MYLVFSMYMVYSSIYMEYTWDIHGYTMESWISIGVDIHGISMDIPWISVKYIHGISMEIHGISYDVYTWYIRGISRDIPGYSYFLKPDFSACPCCWSHSMHTLARVWVIKSILFHAPPWQLCQGKTRTTKALCRRRRVAAAAVLLASCLFPRNAAGIDLNLGERWGRGCLQGR